MQLIAILAMLLSEHDASHWDLSCEDWNQARIEILADENLGQDAQEYLIDYFLTKVPEYFNCEVWQIGRK